MTPARERAKASSMIRNQKDNIDSQLINISFMGREKAQDLTFSAADKPILETDLKENKGTDRKEHVDRHSDAFL